MQNTRTGDRQRAAGCRTRQRPTCTGAGCRTRQRPPHVRRPSTRPRPPRAGRRAHLRLPFYSRSSSAWHRLHAMHDSSTLPFLSTWAFSLFFRYQASIIVHTAQSLPTGFPSCYRPRIMSQWSQPYVIHPHLNTGDRFASASEVFAPSKIPDRFSTNLPEKDRLPNRGHGGSNVLCTCSYRTTPFVELRTRPSVMWKAERCRHARPSTL